MDEKRYKIIYEDDWLIVVDKSSGLLVIPTPKKERTKESSNERIAMPEN